MTATTGVLVASDLDRTLIYSRKASLLGADADTGESDACGARHGHRALPGARSPAPVCVEIHDNKQASFVTAAAAEGLTALSAEAVLVPVTTRILEQYRRVQLPGPSPHYAIVANGGVLLVDGNPDRDWTRQVEKVVAEAYPLHSVWEHVGQLCSPEFTVKLRNAADLFCYAVVHPHRLPSGFVDDLSAWAAEHGWSTSLQGRKLYWVPTGLTKSAAVAEVALRAECATVLAAGDSLLDVDLLLAADHAIHPAHGELYDQGWSAPHVERTIASGIGAGEEIVSWFRSRAAISGGGAGIAG